MSEYHISVLLQEAVNELNVHAKGRYIDATLGGGGHTFEIIRRGGIVLGLDADEDALRFVRKKAEEEGVSSEQLFTQQGNFRHMREVAIQKGFQEVDGVIFDLGVSSFQFDTPERGFSLKHEGYLDMRMDATLSVTAKDLVNGLSKKELEALFAKLGEETAAGRIAGAIVKARERQLISSTGELAQIVKRAVPWNDSKVHPATKVFQALRIAVNDELHSIEEALPQAVSLLKSKGRLVVISFHSLEDRIVKQAFQSFLTEGLGTVLTDKPILPAEEEIAHNTRSRSAKMRVFEKK